MKKNLASPHVAFSSLVTTRCPSRLLPVVWLLALFVLLVLGGQSAWAQATNVALVFNTPGAQSWTAPGGVTNVIVLCWGSGGAGGSSSNPPSISGAAIAGGGSGGGFCEMTNVPVTPGNTYNFTVPPGASSPVEPIVSGVTVSNGFSTTFTGDGGVTVTAVGGNGGQCAVNTSGTVAHSGGVANTQTGGNIDWQGGNGANSVVGVGGGGGGSAAGDSGNGTNGVAVTTSPGTTVGGGVGNPYAGGSGGGGVGAATGGGTQRAGGTAGGVPGGGGGGARDDDGLVTLERGGAGGAGQVVLEYSTTNVSWVGDGVNNRWSINTGDICWDNVGNGLAGSYYPNGGVVTFGIEGSNNPTVNITTPVVAYSIMVNSASNYVFSGAGGIKCASRLMQLGPGTLTLNVPTTLAAPSFVKGGTLVLPGSITNITYCDIGQTNGDNGTLILQGSGSFDTTSDFNVGDVGSSVGLVDISGSASLTANALYVGSANQTNSTASGTLNQTNGTVTTLSPNDGIFMIGGRNSGSTFGVGTYNLYGGTLNVMNAGNAWIGGYGTGTMNMSGGSATFSGYVSVGRQANGGGGSLNISGGSFSQTNGPQSTDNYALIIGEASPGTLTVSGTGIVTVAGCQLTLGQDYDGLGIVNLNGGEIIAPQVVQVAGLGSTFNFNGGILKANVANGTLMANGTHASFMTGLSAANIMGGGAIIDDGGFPITIGQSLQAGDGNNGGLTKIDTGTLLLNGNNTYSGTTLVSQGTLGGSGVISGPVSVASGATLFPGATAGTSTELTIQNNLTLSNGCTVSMLLDKDINFTNNDMVTGLNNVTYAGTLIVTNIGPIALTNGDMFQLFSASGTPLGNFSSIVIQPFTSPLTGTFNPATGILTINTSTIPATPTNITVSVSSGKINLSWPNNYLGWSLQVQTNSLSKGLSTNWFTVPGSSGVTSTNFPVVTTNGSVFYRMFYQP